MEGSKSFSIEALLSSSPSIKNRNKGFTSTDCFSKKTGSPPTTGPQPEELHHRLPEVSPDPCGGSESPRSTPDSVDSMLDGEDSTDAFLSPAGLSHRRGRLPSSGGGSVSGRPFGLPPGDAGSRSIGPHPPSGLMHGPLQHGGLFYRYGGLQPPSAQQPQSQGGSHPSHPGAVALSMLAAGSAFHSPGTGGAAPPGNGGPSGGQGLPPGSEPALRMAAQAQVQAAAAAAHMQNIQLDWLARAGVFIPRMVDYSGKYILQGLFYRAVMPKMCSDDLKSAVMKGCFVQ